jgi:hypothetical protein
MGKFMGEIIKLHKVRLSFPVLDEAEEFRGKSESGEEKRKSFQASFLMDPEDESHAESYALIESEVQRAIDEVWGGERPKKLKIEFYGEGNDRTNAQTGDIYPGYENMQWVSAKSNEDTPPRLKDKRKNDVTDPKKIRKLFYGGVVCNATINVFVPDKTWVRICCGLRTVMTLEHGDSFGSGATDKEFDDFDAEDGDAGDVGAPERSSRVKDDEFDDDGL